MSNSRTLIITFKDIPTKELYHRQFCCEVEGCKNIFIDHIHNEHHICQDCQKIAEWENKIEEQIEKLIIKKEEFQIEEQRYLDLMENPPKEVKQRYIDIELHKILKD